jgi:DNA polymerase
MTSPAQLKYLDAIGVPVWVSRDRLVQLTALQPHDEKQKLSVNSEAMGSADDILHHLDNTTNKDKPTVVNNTENKLSQTHNKVARDTSHTKTPTLTNTATTDPKPSTPHINEIGSTQQHTIYACGNLNADWLIIGESPETSEARKNQPFATDSGVLLMNMLKSVGLQNPREDAYLINVLKQASLADDLLKSTLKLNELLHEKITAINPKIILIVGQVSAQNLLQSTEPLARLRSKAHTLPNTNIPVVVTYYPSYLLSKPADKRKAWDDLKLALSTIDLATKDKID